MFVVLLALLTIASTLGSDFSCNFTKDKCGWFLGGGQTCRWELKAPHSRTPTGYVHLVGAPACSAVLAWSFGSNHEAGANYISFEYYMNGTGPVSVSISNDEDGLNWSCASVTTGSEMRMAHAQIHNKTKYIYIKANVAAGSELIINRIWNSLLGAKAETKCSSHVSANNVTTSTIAVTNAFNQTEYMGKTDDDVIFEQTSMSPEAAMNTTQPYFNTRHFNTTMVGISKESHATTQTLSTHTTNDRDKQLLVVLGNILSGKGHILTVTGNFTMKLNVNILPKPGVQ